MGEKKMSDVIQRLGQFMIIPVISLEDAGDAAALGEALLEAGLPIAEVVFRTAAAADSIRAIAKQPNLLVGAGTVLNVDTVKRAVDAGAKFMVSPGFNPKVVSYCVEQKIPIIPGTSNPTDFEMALDHGLNVVKFFPAEAMGGVKTLKAMAAPYGMMRFVPTGGITQANVADYLRFSKVVACGGSWMVTAELIAAKNFKQIAHITRQAVKLAAQTRPATA
jgi:2-dehydro-3-deoxyphosphogluconate aldolase/(4S)-4-hydroxy-2-oxoglutarate aldolase